MYTQTHTYMHLHTQAQLQCICTYLHMHAQSHMMMYRLVLDTPMSQCCFVLVEKVLQSSSRYVCSASCRASVWVLPGVESRNTCCTKLSTQVFPLLPGVGKDLAIEDQPMKDYVISGQTSKVFSHLVVDFHLQGDGCVNFCRAAHAPATRSTLTIQWIFLFSFSLPVPAWKW